MAARSRRTSVAGVGAGSVDTTDVLVWFGEYMFLMGDY
jgi:hypothetical protein